MARHTFLTNDGFEHPKMKHLTLFNGKRQALVFILLEQLDSHHEINEIESTAKASVSKQ